MTAEASSAALAVSGSFLLLAEEVELSSRGFFGLTTTETVAGSKAEPSSRVRGGPPVGAADSSTTSSIAQPHSRNAAGCRLARWGLPLSLISIRPGR